MCDQADSPEMLLRRSLHTTLETMGHVLHSDYTRFFFNNLIVSVQRSWSLWWAVFRRLCSRSVPIQTERGYRLHDPLFPLRPEILVILPLSLIYQRLGLYETYLGLIWVYQLIKLPLAGSGSCVDFSKTLTRNPPREAAAQLDVATVVARDSSVFVTIGQSRDWSRPGTLFHLCPGTQFHHSLVSGKQLSDVDGYRATLPGCQTRSHYGQVARAADICSSAR